MRAATDEAAELVAGMADAPLLRAALHQSRAQLALHEGHLDVVAEHAHELLDLAKVSSLRLQIIDALELLAAVAEANEGSASRLQLPHGARRERANSGYRFSMLPV